MYDQYLAAGGLADQPLSFQAKSTTILEKCQHLKVPFINVSYPSNQMERYGFKPLWHAVNNLSEVVETLSLATTSEVKSEVKVEPNPPSVETEVKVDSAERAQ